MKGKRGWARTVKAASVYTGVVLGAGFASGQELLKFFVSYGTGGFFGLVLAGAVLALCGWAVLDICVREGVEGYSDFMRRLFGKWAGNLLDIVISMFIFVMFATMLAGVGALGTQALGMPFWCGVVLIGALCLVALMFGVEGVIGVNTVLAPLLVAGGVFFGLYAMFTDYVPVFLSGLNPLRELTDNWIWSAVIYASYNVITAVSVLTNMGETVTSRRTARNAGLLGGLCMCILGICFCLPLFRDAPLLGGLELPMLAIAQRYGAVMEGLYVLLLLAAIFTTAVSNAFAFAQWLHQKTGLGLSAMKALVVIAGVLMANIGFSSFVGIAYPIFGYVGLLEIAVIIIYFIAGYKGKDKDRR